MVKSLINRLKSAFVKSEEGQGTIEYILVLGVIVVGIFALVNFTGLGTAMNEALGAVIALFGSNPFT
jgi:Flp pilus assembly pilin Flp